MNLKKEFKLFILPLIKGLPLLLTIMIFGYLLADYALEYITPEYEVNAKIKLDNREHGTRDFELFEEQKSSNSGSNFLTEVEVFKTKSLQRRALEGLDFDITYQRRKNGSLKELYKESPFLIDYKILDTSAYNKDFFLKYVGNGKYRFYADSRQEDYLHSLKYNKAYTDSTSISYRIRRNDDYLKRHPDALQGDDFFSFRINKIESIVDQIDNSNFFCQPVDKEVYIVKLYYMHHHPKKAVDFLNALLDTYIETAATRKNKKANKMLAFIEGKLDSLGHEMHQASVNLSTFRKQNNIINPKQETEAILRQLNEFDIKKLTLDLKEIEFNNIYDFLKTDKELTGFSPDFEMVKDDVFEHTFMDLKKLEIEKFEQLKKYPETSLEIQTINNQVNELKAFIFKSIEKKLINIDEQRNEIASFINRVQGKFESYPDKERQLAKLEREFNLKEETFNYLNKKKLELDIAHSADHSLHEIVDYATLPSHPSSPNRPLILGIVVFASMIFGMILIYALNFFLRTVSTVSELNEELALPLMGTVGKQKGKQFNKEILLNLYSNSLNLGAFEGSKMITISSVADNEGKTFVAKELGTLLAEYGKKVLLIDMNLKPEKNDSSLIGELLNMTGFGANQNRLKGQSGNMLTKLYWTRKLYWMFDRKHATLQDLVSTEKSQTNNLDYVFLSGENQTLTSTQLFSPNTADFLREMKNNYDVVLIDTENITKKVDAAAAMMLSDYNLFVFRKGVTKIRAVKECKKFVENYSLKNVYTVLNGVN